MAKTSFRDLIKEAVTADDHFQKLATGTHRQTFQGFLRDACKKAEREPEFIHELHAILNKGGHPGCMSFIRSLSGWLKSGNMKRVPAQLMRIRCHSNSDCAEEMGKLSINLWDLMAVCVLHTHDNHPEVFGELDSWEVYHADIARAERERDRAMAALKNFSADDLNLDGVDGTGNSPAFFKFCGPSVTFTPGWQGEVMQWGRRNREKLGLAA